MHETAEVTNFLSNLRETGSIAEVVLFIHGETPPMSELYHRVKQYPPAKILATHWDRVANIEDSIMVTRFAIWASYLDSHGDTYERSMHCTLGTRFQSDPFLNINSRHGLALVLEDPWTVQSAILKKVAEPRKNRQHVIGENICTTYLHKAVANVDNGINYDIESEWANRFREVSVLPAIGFALGTSRAHRQFIVHFLNRISKMRGRNEELDEDNDRSREIIEDEHWDCAERQLLAMDLHSGLLAAEVGGLTLYLESESLIAMTPGQQISVWHENKFDEDECIINSRGARVAVIYKPDNGQVMW